MNFLFFLVHPSKYHVFKNTINRLKQNGHNVEIVITSKDVLEELVKNEGWQYTNIFPEGRKMKGVNPKISAGINTIRTIYRLRKYLKKRKYDLFITDDLIVINGKLRKTPTIHFQDDDITAVPESALLFHFATHMLSPSVSNFGKYQHKKIPFLGYKELGGLHPHVFTPDHSIVQKFNKNNDPYFIIRLVSLRATHDIGKSGLNNTDVLRLINMLEQHGKVYITAERELPEEFEKYRINIRPNDIAHALSFAQFLISDSQTMSAEAGVLGTPYIRFNDFVDKISYLAELENTYKLGVGIKTKDKEKLFTQVENFLNNKNLKEEWALKRKKMLDDKIDLTAFMVWLFENYPKSIDMFNVNPHLQNQFKIKS
jgi:predicted glycosyltransferase